MLCFWQKATIDALLASSILFTLSCLFSYLCTFSDGLYLEHNGIRWSEFLEASARGGLGR